MLLNVFSNGTAQSVQPAGYAVAGKTGTTETDNEVGIADQWVVGYTPILS
jgi:Membrane carboxypeptidase (penicillin-binding protein)